MAPAVGGRASRRRGTVTTAAAQALRRTHRQFDRELAPIASVESGGVLVFDCPGPALASGATAADAAELDHAHPHPLVGPVEIEGAEPGDAVVIDVLQLELPQPYGHSLIIPGAGLLEEFDDLYVQNFSFAGGFAYLRPDVRVPLEPFCGVMGLAPAEPGPHSTIPPRRVGGNLDIRDLTAGASLILPVEVDGGLFSCGDGHAAQGDGEVCVTAIETAVRATLRFRLLKGLDIPMPRFLAPAAPVPRGDKGRIGACGVGDDLIEGCRAAVRGLMSQLTSERGLSREEAYVLCSVAADLRLNEVVNLPNYVVTAQLPLDVFCGPSAAETDDISPPCHVDSGWLGSGVDATDAIERHREPDTTGRKGSAAVLQIGVDVGGTFTDFVVGRRGGDLFKTKSPTTPGNEAEGILNGLREIATEQERSLGELLADTEVIVLGTTVVVNTMLEYSGAKTGLVTTKGFRDIIELRRGYREHLFDIRLPAPHPIVPRERRLGVMERVDHRGNVLIPLDEENVRAAAEQLREMEVESIAVCLLFSFLNPDHEHRVEEVLDEVCPGVPVTLSSRILPQVREFERLSTTIVNAYTRPKVERYLTNLRAALEEAGFGGELFVMQSNGGMAHIEYAATHSVELLMSGPAGGVVAGAGVSELSGYRDVITVDLGGTSYDVCLVKNSMPTTGTDAWVSRYRVATPMVDIHTVGAGGGSIAWIDDGGALRVGPRSAGASPGPVCYGRGGTEPTVTDAALVLGYISPDYFLGGKMELDVAAANTAISEKVGEPLGLDPTRAAAGIFQIANNSMSNAIRHVTVARGRDPRDFALCVFGGAGAIHAGEQAPSLGIRTILVPKSASVLSALGNQVSNFKVSKVRSFIQRVDVADIGALNDSFADMLADATADLGTQGKVTEITTARFMEMRYVGQTHEVSVPIRSRTRRVTQLNFDQAAAHFHELHEQLFSFKRVEHPTEILGLRLELVGVRDTFRLPSHPFEDENADVALKGTREVYFEAAGGRRDTPIYDGGLIRPGHLVTGPAVIEEPDTTIVVYPDQEAMCDHYGTYVIEIP